MNRKALHKMTYGLYIVSARFGEQINGQIANTVFQITSQPPTVAAGICKANLTHQYISESRSFCVSILSKETPLSFISRFGFCSGRNENKFDGVNYHDGASGSPIVLDHTLGYIDVGVEQEMDVGTHTIFVGKVIDADVVGDEPMTYADYHQLKRSGTAPAPPAPPPEAGGPRIEKIDTYRCTVCDYIYDPRNGDPQADIAPGTRFEDLPDAWVCPVCGATKADFVKEN